MVQVRKLSIVIIVVLVILIGMTMILILNNHKAAKKQLFTAIEEGDCDKVAEILDDHPSLVNENRQYFFLIDVSGETPLLAACRYNNFEMMQLLVERGADVNKSARAVTAYPLINILCRGGEKRYDMAWYLIENGADLSVKQRFETVPFAIVSYEWQKSNFDTEIQSKSLELMKFVLDEGVSLEPPDQKVFGIDSVYGLAARNNYVLIVQYFLDNELFSIDEIVDEENRTALMVAVQGQAYDVCEYLLDNGADKTMLDASGKSAYDYAKELNDEKLLDLLG